MSDQLQVSEVPGDVASVVDRLTAGLRDRGVEVFATIDHAAGARAAGLDLADEVLLVFGDPAVGTALMQADPRAGVDLPLRVLVWSQDGVTRLAYQDPAVLAEMLAAVEAVNSQSVVVLPNNGNIVPVARQLDALTSKAVLVVPTRLLSRLTQPLVAVTVVFRGGVRVSSSA